MNRRDVLRASGALCALFGLGAPLHAAAAAPGDRKFLFVFNSGGWDPTRVFADAFDLPVDMEPTAQRAQVGDIHFVDHVERPSVRAFFEAHASRATVFNGMLVSSVAHEACTRICMTGSTDDGRPDWGAMLASDQSGLLLPSLVVAGPSFAGPLGSHVIRTGQAGQLQDLIDGSSVRTSGGTLLGAEALTEVDAYLARRAAAAPRGTASETRVRDGYAGALDQLGPLRGLNGELDLGYAFEFRGQTDLAVEALAAGTSRCVTIAHGDGQWDSHAGNDATQSFLFESLFAGLLRLMEQLQTTPGTSGGTLAEETTVVVLSEMGRTPLKNGDDGKDHWPYTSAMVLSDAFVGDRVIGTFDSGYQGRNLDPRSGEVFDGGEPFTAQMFGATLLASAGLDPLANGLGAPPITGVIN